jgi:hypothetical protein
MNKRKFLIIGILGVLLLVAGLMIGCPSTYSGGDYANVEVRYIVNGESISSNADDTLSYTILGPGTDYRKLTWYCGNYRGYQKSRVDLTFKKSNDTWLLDNEDYGSGRCK